MKRIIASLLALVIGTTAATSVIACSRGASMRTIDIEFGDNLKFEDYKTDDLLKAYNGTKQTAYSSLPLSGANFSLLNKIVNVFSLDTTLFTNSREIPRWRTSLIGMDETSNNISKPSVDGLYFEGYDKLNPTDFYKNFENTHINSLGGLYRLYTMVETKKIEDSTKIGTAAQESLALAQSAFAKGSDGEKFIDSFLSLHNQSYNSAWLSITVDADAAPTKLNSQILSYNIETKEEDNKKINEYQFVPTGARQDLGKYLDFDKVNTKATESGHDGEKIGDRYNAPFDLLMLPANNAGDIQNSQFDTSWTYDKDEVDGQKRWDIRKPGDAGFNWNFKSTKQEIEGKNQTGYIRTNESIIIPLKPLKIQFTYSTNVKDADADKYVVNIILDGLQAVFSPAGGASSFKNPTEDAKTIGNRFIKWQFTHYQFTNQTNTTVKPGWDQRNKAGFGSLSGLHISSLEIKKLIP